MIDLINQVALISLKQRPMQNEFECTKIKDGLYLGTLATTQDYEFLQINKFAYVVNCSAEVPNYFENGGIKYLKFKLVRDRSHKLWEENLKKLRKLERFIEEAEQQSLCCIICSAHGNNRSLVMLTAYLMSRYRWTLGKTLAYIRAKNVFIGLSENYISQLEALQPLLAAQENKKPLSDSWAPPYGSQQEEIIAKTFINSQEIPIPNLEKKQKKERRVTWQDKIDKEKKKQVKESKMKQTGIQQFKKVKSNQKFVQQGNPYASLSTKALRKETIQSPLKKSQNLKKGKRGKNASVCKVETEGETKKVDNFDQFSEPQKQQQREQTITLQDSKLFTDKQLLKLIKKNLKIKKQSAKQQPKEEKVDKSQKQKGQRQENIEKGVYKLTINNFISPNINILNSIQNNRTKSTKIPRKDEKIVRAQSQKDSLSRNNNQTLKQKPDRSGKIGKRNTQNSPLMKEKKLEKAVSLQFKKGAN